MRIISGEWKGKKLESPASHDIRPTSDRAREALFNLLIHMDKNPIVDQPVLDCCCGTGALGLEALSRGARFCYFIDNHQEALRLVRRNIDVLSARKRAEVIASNVTQLPPAREAVALVMIDPPYQHLSLVPRALSELRSKGWMDADSVLSVETSARDGEIELPGMEAIKIRRYGKSQLQIFAQASV